MSPIIRISDTLYKRLETRAVGFDTPAKLIERLLDEVDNIQPNKIAELTENTIKPELVFNPVSEDQFKKLLVKNKQAEIALYKSDGTREISIWNASRFRSDSNLRGNLWSGQLRGWKEKCIIKAEISILPSPNCIEEVGEIEQTKVLASYFNLKYDEMERLEFEIGTNESNDGLIYNYIIQFNDNCPQDILDMIPSLSSGNSIDVDVNAFDQPDYDE